MRFYVEAYGHDNRQILGNLDGQTAWEGRFYTHTRWYRDLIHRKALNNRVAYWWIVNGQGERLEIVYPTKG